MLLRIRSLTCYGWEARRRPRAVPKQREALVFRTGVCAEAQVGASGQLGPGDPLGGSGACEGGRRNGPKVLLW